MSAVGIDSLKIELGSAPRAFEGLLGIAVTCKKEEPFVDQYKHACQRLWQREEGRLRE